MRCRYNDESRQHSRIAVITPSERLRANTIGPWGLAALAIGITSPAMGLYGQWGPMQVMAGPITPLIFLAAMLLTLPTAISYALLNHHAPSSGSASTWLWTTIGPVAGFLAGLAMVTYFAMATIAQPLIFALFFRDFVIMTGLPIGDMPAMIIGILVATLPVAIVGLRGAEASIRTAVLLMIVETLVVLALSATILAVRAGEPGAINLSPFDPTHATGLSGFWQAMILGALSYCGFDVVSTAAEEAKAPRAHLPKAILLTVAGITIFWMANAWVFTLAVPPAEVAAYTASGLTAVTPLAQKYWGAGSLVIVLTAFTGITAVYISCMQGTSRLLFVLARHRLLPSWLGALSGEDRIPRRAILALLAATVVLDVLTLLVLQNGLDSFVWWANGLVFFATLTFLAVNVANIAYFWRLPGHRFNLVRNLLIPAIGILMNAYLIYAAFFQSLWAGNLRSGKSVVIACVALLVAQVVVVTCMRIFNRKVFDQPPPIGAAPEPAGATQAH